MNRYAILLSDEGPNAEIIQANEGESLLDFCYRAIGCSCIELVIPEGLQKPYCLVIDEEGLFVNQPKLNVIASTWFGTDKHHQPIVGKALVMKDVWKAEGKDIAFLSEIEAEKIVRQPIRIPLSLLLGFV